MHGVSCLQIDIFNIESSRRKITYFTDCVSLEVERHVLNMFKRLLNQSQPNLINKIKIDASW